MIELIELLKKTSGPKKKKVLQEIFKKHWMEIYETTKFLDIYNASAEERLYCIINHIDFVIKCPFCGEKATFNGKRYDAHCASQECKDKLSASPKSMKSIYKIDEFGLVYYYDMLAEKSGLKQKTILEDKYDICEKFKYLKNELIEIVSIKTGRSFVNINYKKCLSVQFPELLCAIVEDFGIFYLEEVVYCICNDIPYIPKCPICGLSLKIKDFNVGFRQYCSNECLNKMQKIRGADTVAKHIKALENGSSECSKILTLEHNGRIHKYYSKSNNDIVIIDYNCKHHKDLCVRRNLVKTIEIYSPESELCIECNKEKNYDNYNPTEDEIKKFQDSFEEFFEENKFKMKYEWWMTFYPKEKKMIDVYYDSIAPAGHHSDNGPEKVYVFRKKLKKLPSCMFCNRVCSYTSANGYSVTCELHNDYEPNRK